MPRNPMLTSGRDAQNIGVNRPDQSAEPHKSYIQRENDFDLSYIQLATLRYADVHPFFAMDALPADHLPFRSFHELRSYTLQSPMLSDVKLHKSFTMVPMEAILPNTWERFIVNPTKGDDVPEDVYCSFPVAFIPISALIQFSDVHAESVINTVKAMIVAECVYSTGSLLSSLKIDFSRLWPDFDVVFDTQFVPFLKKAPIKLGVNLGNVSASVTLNPLVADASSAILIDNVHDFLDILRDGCTVDFVQVDPLTYTEEFETLSATILEFTNTVDLIDPNTVFTTNVDISKVLAYQLSCVQIMTDDSIDDIYTPALFRDMIYELTDPKFFTYNGSPIQYDSFSSAVLLSAIVDSELGISVDKVYRLYTLLFSYRKSLKYGDYFIDARPEPYAVGDMTAEVKDGAVSAIDSTRSILAQRFLNWSNRVGNKLHDYILALTGVVPTARTTEPKYIIHEVFDVSGFEVENTGSEQRDDVSVTTHLKTQDCRYMFDINVNDYCIILGLVHFDAKRIYTGGVDRSNLKQNRFDYFNKFFQYAGDQDIKRIELSSALPNANDAMAYTTRHMQYKKAVSHAVGGFSNGSLPSWAFVNDETNEQLHGIGVFGINSDFIRNHNGEFDRFYGPLTGYSLGNYFHFIVKFNNIANMERQMAKAPDIL